jgi:hypothetical protein
MTQIATVGTTVQTSGLSHPDAVIEWMSAQSSGLGEVHLKHLVNDSYTAEDDPDNGIVKRCLLAHITIGGADHVLVRETAPGHSVVTARLPIGEELDKFGPVD